MKDERVLIDFLDLWKIVQFWITNFLFEYEKIEHYLDIYKRKIDIVSKKKRLFFF